MQRLLQIALAMVVLSCALALPALADVMDCPEPMGVTVEALHHCVQHAAEMGHIDNSGIAQSLLSKVNAARAAVDRGHPGTAVNILGAFIHEVRAQAGKHIDAAHADHMIMHAQMVIDALSS